MKKIASLLLVIIMLISCATVLSSCTSEIKEFDDLTTFISENGKNYKITKKLSEFDATVHNTTTIVTIAYKDGDIVLEETTEYNDHTVRCEAVCDQNADSVKVLVEHVYPDHKSFYKGYIIEGEFCDTNKETDIDVFETNNTSLAEADAMAILGEAVDDLLSHTSSLLKNVGSPVSLYDIGFNSAYK